MAEDLAAAGATVISRTSMKKERKKRLRVRKAGFWLSLVRGCVSSETVDRLIDQVIQPTAGWWWWRGLNRRYHMAELQKKTTTPSWM